MLVGPTCGGKTTVLQALAGSLHILDGTVVKQAIINPKAQELNELYGTLDVLTRDWTDGILPQIFRSFNQPLLSGRLKEKRWIVFDGDVDAIWVENLNSVMDDNRILTIPNGERIRLQSYCALICEVYDLQYASPATISRCGMVWMDPTNLGYEPFYERWFRLRYSENKPNQFLMQLFVKYCKPSIEYVLYGNKNGTTHNKLSQVIPVGVMELCKQLCNFLDAFLPSPHNEVKYDFEYFTNIYMYCVLHAIGGGLKVESRLMFHEFLLEQSDVPLPENNLYDYFFCQETNEWRHLDSKVAIYQEPNPFYFHRVFVPTKSSVLYQELLEKLSPVCSLLLVGDRGAAKTVICENFISSLSCDKYSDLRINFSSMIKSTEIKAFLDSKIEKRMGSIYGAPLGKKLAVFIDDLHMPQVDRYGTRQPIALLLTLLDHGFYHCCSRGIQQKIVKGIQMVGAMGSISIGGNHLDPRFISKFGLLHLPTPPEDELYQIFSKILETRVISSSESLHGNQLLVAEVTRLSLGFFNLLNDALQPSPSKFHYIFTLKDMARVFEGLCSLNESWYDDKKLLIRFWRNEVHRVFFDRLISENDIDLVNNILNQVIEGISEKKDFEYITKSPMLFLNLKNISCFDNYKDDGESESDYPTLQRLFVDTIEHYNTNKKHKLSLVPFDFAIDHLLRIFRALKFPKGHALLVGVGGSGKKSLTRLASYAMGYSVFELEIIKGYSHSDFCEDVKEMLKLACSQPLVFLLPDDHVLSETFLEQISYILNVGIPPGLFDKDEMEALYQSYECDEKSLVDMCVSNLHVVFAMSPSGETLKMRCRKFPSLITACVIDWFFPWPQEALEMIAKHCISSDSTFLSKVNINIDDVSKHMTNVHLSVDRLARKFCLEMKRSYQITPKIFIDYLTTFQELLRKAIDTNSVSTKRLDSGLEKISDVSRDIERMKVELNEKKVIVDKKTIDIELLITSIQEKTHLAQMSSREATSKQVAAEEQGEIIKVEKEKADAALMEALPAVEAAAEALNNIKREDLQELKAFNNPPLHVKIVCQMCTILRPTGEKLDETWNDSKKMLGNTRLLDMLKDYPKENFTERMYQRCKKILKDNKKHDISVENMSTKSQAGKGLLVWVLAILRYYEVARNVDPLREKVKEMQKAQGKTEKEVHDLKSLLKTLDLELNDLEVKYNEAKKELSELQLQASQMHRRLDSASSLINGLQSEQKRWKLDRQNLLKDNSRIIGNYLLFAGFQSYVGAFHNEFRHMFIKNAMNDLRSRLISYDADFKPEDFMLTNSELQQWVANGLSKDSFSLQNGILTMKGSRFPVCIDPQEQALGWIQKMFASSQVIVKSLKDKDYLKHLELALEFGNPFVFKNIGEEIDSILDNLISKSYIIENGLRKVVIGDKIIELDDQFRLFFCTKINNPQYTPEMMGKINLVNYSITRDGLCDQLLNMVINNERPELELQHIEIVNVMTSNMVKLTQLEDSLLKELASSTGNILDNESLISTLEQSKLNALMITSKIDECNLTKQIIEGVRSSYRSVSRRGSALYFSSSALVSISNMYEFSLSTFIEQFKIALQAAERNDVLEIRLKNLVDSCTSRLYKFTCTGIFEQHRLTYSFTLAIAIMKDESESYDSSMVTYFSKGSAAFSTPSEKIPSYLSWMSTNSWELLVYIAKYNVKFSHVKTILVKESQFLRWVQSEYPERRHPPQINGIVFSNIEILCLLKIFRPDRCYIATKLFIVDSIGEQFVDSPTLSYRDVYVESKPTSPIIFILSKGADPQVNVQNLGDQVGFKSPEKLSFISLGQGQGSKADSMLEVAYVRGHWVMIQNCHLLILWINGLEAKMGSLGTPHKDFRLWLTTEPSIQFPANLLQRSFRIVVEPPDCMKLNMLSTLNNIDQTVLDSCPHPAFHSILYCLTFLHAVLQERKKYGKLGWNSPYDFNGSDFNVSRQLISTYLSKAWSEGKDEIPWESLKYLVGDAMYGGRVSDEIDRRILQAYFDEYFGDFIFSNGQNFQFSTLHPTYIIPQVEEGKLEEYMNHIDAMPSNTKPGVLGLHSSANLKYVTDRMEDLWNTLATKKELDQSRDGQLSSKVTKIMESLSICNPETGSFEVSTIRKHLVSRSDNGIVTPCDTVLLQELDRWNQVWKSIYRSLSSLQKALNGETVMSDQLEDIALSLNKGDLPKLWEKLAPPTTKKLPSWMSHFRSRFEQYTEWIESGQPKFLWLSGLHSPQSFLSALLQTTCRKKGWALDETIIHTEVTKYTNHNSSMGMNDTVDVTYIKGLYLEGAGWDVENSKLTHQQSNNDTITELPLVKLVPIQKKSLNLKNSFRAPVYLTKSRLSTSGEGLVFEAFLGTDISHSFWILQGVAIIMNLD